MPRDAEEIPFRKVEGENRFDAAAYCPVCRSGEIEITRTYTQQWNIIALTWAEVDYPEKPGTLFPKKSPE